MSCKKVINKQKSNPHNNYGFVTMCSQQNDTLTFLVSAEEEYLNVKVGDVYLVGRNKYGSLFINQKVDKNIIGYSTVIAKEIKNGVPICQVVTRGEDVLSAKIAEVVYYNVSVGDSVFVKKNRDKNKPHYYVE